MENLYKTLHCDEHASFQELKKSYQTLALQCHPDKSKSGQTSSEKFVRINRAWKILSDTGLREQYNAKWKERCLAQAYPIQDNVYFDEFEKQLEASNTESGEGGQEFEGLSHCEQSRNCDDCEKGDSAGLPPLSDDDTIYMYDCRCGGSYVLTGVDVKLKFDIVCCDTCSLSIQVIYGDEKDKEAS